MYSTENSSISKKCGNIIISIKKNTKNVYSFNCLFCDTICIKMKKFTMHLEQEHGSKLEEYEAGKDDFNADTSTGQDFNAVKAELLLDEKNNENLEHKVEGAKARQHEQEEISLPEFPDPLETKQNQQQIQETQLHQCFEVVITEDPVKEELSVKELYEPENDSKMESAEEHDEQDICSSADDCSLANDTSASDTDFRAEDDATYPKYSRKKNVKLSEKKVISAIIEAYKNKPQLWAISGISEKFSLKQKEDFFQELAQEVNLKCKTKFKWTVIRTEVTRICRNYQNVVAAEKAPNTEEKKESQLWYAKDMEFLRETIEYKLKHKRKKPKHKVKPLNNNLLLELIDIYKNYNSLWDVNHLAFAIKDKRIETMQLMLKEINEKMKLQLNLYKLEKNLLHIHKLYADEKNKRLLDTTINEESQVNQACSVSEYYEKCDFLAPHQGPFKCKLCLEIVQAYNDYQIHLSQHDGSMPFKCPDCGQGFKRMDYYKLHVKRHLGLFKFHCEICEKGFPLSSELDLHMRLHTGAQPFLCSLCGESFRYANAYDNHVRRHEKSFRYSCEICNRGFYNLTRLNDHVKAHLNVRDIICNICGKAFTSRNYLNYHKRIHGEKKYNCNICGKSFAQDSGLRQHKKNHGTPVAITHVKTVDSK